MKLWQRTFLGALIRVPLAILVLAVLVAVAYHAISPRFQKSRPAPPAPPHPTATLDSSTRQELARKLRAAIERAETAATLDRQRTPAGHVLDRQDLQDIIADLIASPPKDDTDRRLAARIVEDWRVLTGRKQGSHPKLPELLELQERLLRGQIGPSDTTRISSACDRVPPISERDRMYPNRPLAYLCEALRCLCIVQDPEPEEGVIFNAAPWKRTRWSIREDQAPPKMDISDARRAAALATRDFPRTLPEGYPAENYHIQDVADIDGDGIYEVAVQEQGMGSGGSFFYGFFWLGSEGLVPIPTTLLQDNGGIRAGIGHAVGSGDAEFSSGGAWYRFPIWVKGPHSSPDYLGRSYFVYRPLRGLIEVRCDTIPFPT